MRSTGSTNSFGFWTSPAISLVLWAEDGPAGIYVVDYVVRSTVAKGAACRSCVSVRTRSGSRRRRSWCRRAAKTARFPKRRKGADVRSGAWVASNSRHSRTFRCVWVLGLPGGDVICDPQKLYIVTFTVESSIVITEQTRVPQFRLRLNETSFHGAAFTAIESQGTADRSPTYGHPKDYVVCFQPPECAAGESLVAALDYINFDPNDRSDATLYLHRVRIESVPAARWDSP